MSQKRYYLDNAATTKDRSHPISPTNTNLWERDANSHSVHAAGINATKEIEAAETIILDYINGHCGTILWTGSGSQANSLAIRTICQSFTLVTTAIEHKSILQHFDIYGQTKVNPNKFGRIDPCDIRGVITPYTDMVSVQMINNETGVVQPVKEIGRIVPNYTFFHVDAVQALGKIPIDVDEMNIDLLTFSSHKTYGPKGLGGLWVRNTNKDINFEYLGTKPTELILRLADVFYRIEMQHNMNWVATLEHEFLKHLTYTKIKWGLNANYNRLVGLFSMHFPGIDADELMFSLSDKGVYVSTGSACDNGSIEPSHVLTAMKIPEQQINSTIRISIGHTNTMYEVQEAAQIIGETVKELKNGS